MSYYNPQINGTDPRSQPPPPPPPPQHPSQTQLTQGGMFGGVVAGTGFRSMAAAIARRNDRERDSGSDDNVFESVDNVSRKSGNRNRRKSRSHHASSIGRPHSSRASRSPSYASSNDSRPTRTSRGTRSVHSRSTFSRRTFTNRSISTYTDDSDDSRSSYSSSSYTHTTMSSRSMATKSHTTNATNLTQKTRSVAQLDGRSTAHSVLPTAPPVVIGTFALPTQYNEYSRPRIPSTAARSDHGADASYGQGSASDSGSSRSRTPAKKVDANKLAIAALLDSTAAGGFDCLLEDPNKQPQKKNRPTRTKRRASSKTPRHASASASQRAISKSIERQSSVASRDDNKSVLERKEQAAEYRLNIPMLERFCMEFSAPFSFATADSDAFAQQQLLDAKGIHTAIPVNDETGVPLNTKNAVNASLMATVNKCVQFVLHYGPKYPSEMVRAILWRVEQSSNGPHDRLGAWKLLDGALRCLHRKHAAYLKQEQAFKAREAQVQQEQHAYNLNSINDNAEEDVAARIEKDSLFYGATNTTLSAINAERTAARSSIRWVKVMLAEISQLLPYLILFCWGGDRAPTKGRRNKNKKGHLAIKSITSGSSAGATGSVASDTTQAAAAVDELAVLKSRVMDFVTGRAHGDGSMTERGQKHYLTLLLHHHTLDAQAANTANPRNTITTQSRFAVGNGVHLTTSKAKAIVTDQEISVINQQIFSEYETILRGWHALFASKLYYISYVHIKRAVEDYTTLLLDHENATAGKGDKHRDGKDLYHFALKASNLKQIDRTSTTDTQQSQNQSIYNRQRQAFENYLLPPPRIIDALWRFRRSEPRPSLVASVLAQYGYQILKAPTAVDTSTPLYDESRLPARNNSAEPDVLFVFPKNAEEVESRLGHPLNDRLHAWVTKAAESQGGCIACDCWSHTFNTCPYRPSRFVSLNRQIVASMSATEAVDVLKVTASRSISDRSAVAPTLSSLAGGGAMQSTDRAMSGTYDAARPDSIFSSSEQQDFARKQLILDVLDVAVERAAGNVEMDTQLNALDVILRQSSNGRERQALALLASYRLQPSRMLQFTKSASMTENRKTKKRKPGGVFDFAKGGRTAAAEKLLAFLNQEHRYYESGRLRAAFETLYYRYLCIPHNDGPLLLQILLATEQRN